MVGDITPNMCDYDCSPLHLDLSPLQKEMARQLLDGEPTSLNPGLHENSHVVWYDESSFEHLILPFGGLGRTGHFLTATVSYHPQCFIHIRGIMTKPYNETVYF